MGRKRHAKRSLKKGMPPGSLVHVGMLKSESTTITATAYDDKGFYTERVSKASELDRIFALRGRCRNIWINVDGLGDIEVVKRIGEFFSIHPLTVEDVLNAEQRPKRDVYETFLYLSLKSITLAGTERTIEDEQVSIILGKDFVLTFQEKVGDCFAAAENRLRNSGGRMRAQNCDYLFYTLIDNIVDNYFAVLEEVGEKIEALEDELVAEPGPEQQRKLHEIKRQSIFLRRAIWPLRDAIAGLERGESPLIGKEIFPFLRDVYFHLVEIIDTIETFREMLGGMLEVYLSSLSNRLNAVMKVLTIITTIFMPISFVAGLYGMNFHHMPELSWHYGYPMALVMMLTIALIMLTIFRKKKWL